MSEAPEISGNASRDDSFAALMDDFVRRIREGGDPSVEEYAEAHPELAARIRESFPVLLLIEKARKADPASPAPPEGSGGPFAGKRETWKIGEYRIVREVGRGGMGIVYEAEQESLGRRVALKLLPFQATRDRRVLDRFLREARAAATLQHPHIVSVHGIGEQEGVHYYIMQYIEGQGLDEVLGEVKRIRGRPPEEVFGEPGTSRSPPSESGLALLEGGVHCPVDEGSGAGVHPSAAWNEGRYFRAAARLAADAAEALEYAHRQGILHRDVKPSNLLLDRSGAVWLTDFGLAKAREDDDLTKSGELLGTLRYMAPERLRGWSDPRSDVYGLGLTLYELLTLEPAFDDTDRSRLMRRIAEEDPPRPRKVNPGIPRDLETVVLKATAKEPGHRYPTAEAFALDLRRFLADEPVLARQSGVWSRGAKWARRKPAAAALALVSLLAVITVVGGSLWYGARLRAESARSRANFQKSLDATYRMLTWVGDGGLITVPQIEPVRRGLLEDALRLHQGFLAENPSDPFVRLEAARAYRRVGEIYQLVGLRTEARNALGQSEILIEGLRREFPEDARYKEELTTVKSLRSLADDLGLPASGLPVSRFPVGVQGAAVVDVAAADVDGDGRMDLIAANRATSDLVVLRGKGDRQFEPAGKFPTGDDPYQMAVVDLDLDGKSDIVTMNHQSRSLSILLAEGKGSFAQASHLSLGFAQPWALVIADLDGDGAPEAAVSGGQHDVRILDRRDGNFILGPSISTGLYPNSLAAGDLDGDGRVDLVAGCLVKRRGTLSLLWSRGDGAFEDRVDVPFAALPIMLFAADLDGDGRVDLVGTDFLGKVVCVARNAGGRSFREGLKYPVSPSPYGVALADVDGDGDGDLVASNEDEGVVSILLNQGDATFPHLAQFLTGGYAFRGTVADIDGDGRADIAVANGVADDVAVMFHVREVIERSQK